MRFIVIGLGSMGKRRIRLLKKYFGITDITGIDSREDRRTECESLFGIKTAGNFTSFRSEDFSAVLVCTAPFSHSNIILDCLTRGFPVFTEINLIADNYGQIIELAKKNGKKVFLSSTPLYRKEVIHITNLVQETTDSLNYIYHVGQYLPDWHPWENFTDFFVGDKRTNGCREIFAIELPWIINTFGEITAVHTEKSKKSKLSINFDDTYIAIITHASGHTGIFCVDVVSRKAVRSLDVIGENTYIKWDGTPDSLLVYDTKTKKNIVVNPYKKIEKNQNYAQNIIENMYVDELRNFIHFLEGTEIPKYSFEKDIVTLQIIDKIEGIN